MGPSPVRAASKRPLPVGSGWIYRPEADWAQLMGAEGIERNQT